MSRVHEKYHNFYLFTLIITLVAKLLKQQYKNENSAFLHKLYWEIMKITNMSYFMTYNYFELSRSLYDVADLTWLNTNCKDYLPHFKVTTPIVKREDQGTKFFFCLSKENLMIYNSILIEDAYIMYKRRKIQVQVLEISYDLIIFIFYDLKFNFGSFINIWFVKK